jgi:NAD+ kinase
LDDSVANDFYCPGYRCGKLADWIDAIDLAIIIGGDGTMLSVGRQIVNHGIPIMGINQGRLGFMTDISADEMLPIIKDMLMMREYVEEERTLLSAQVIRDGKFVYNDLALNDIVISRGAKGSMIEFEMSINNAFVQTQKSDGVIFSTPTGSTAYSLAAGGAILHTDAKVFSIVPICPQSMSNRPIVISDDAEIELTITRDTTTIIHYDGQEYFDLAKNDKVVISKSKRPLRLLHPMSYNYFNTLRTKLDWAKRVS